MSMSSFTNRAVAAAALLLVVGAARAADGTASTPATSSSDVSTEINALKARIADLEAKENSNWLSDDHTAQIKQIVADVLKDAQTRSQFADGPTMGYDPNNGFFIQDASENNKVYISGFAQIRYEGAQSNAYNGRSFASRSVGTGSSAGSTTPSDPGNSSGFDIRRARISVAGNIFTKDLTFKLEGDFYGSAAGAFTVTDAYLAYRFNDQFKVKVGSYKVPFAKAELTSDTQIDFAERAEVLEPFDPIRALGVSLYGDVIKDTLSYEVNINDGGANSNNLRRDDTVGGSANLDNRLAAYARMQWAGSGKLGEFSDEGDLRDKNDTFIWLLGGAVGYESQNATNNAFPSPQTSSTTIGISNKDGPGFTNYTLNGDLFRGTIDWSAKYQGWSFLTAGYFQQVNANPGNTSSTSATTITTGPFGATDSSFFQWGTYGQVGYFLIPQKLEVVGRAGMLATEGYPNVGEFYSVGANYYVYKHNFKIQSDVTFTPEAAYTDSAEGLLQNTHDIIWRVQVQLKF